MKVLNFGSGSEGNTTLISYKDTNILIDAGINYKTVGEKLKKLGINKIDGILITHEHGDHIKYLERMQKMFQCKIYITEMSYYNIKYPTIPTINEGNLCFIEPNHKYQLNDLFFVPIPLMHDTLEIVGFLIKLGNNNLGYVADTGIFPDQYLPLFKEMNIQILESNHDVEMLLESNRPYFLKHRILGDHGHLSNEQAADVLRNTVTKKTKVVMLAHLSRECNTPELAYDAVVQVLNDLNQDVKLYILNQYQETEVTIDD